MISLSADEVERRFALLGIPNRFSASEKQALRTTTVVNPRPGTVGFPTPTENHGLNLLNLREMLGTNPSQMPCFFDHPWYLNEPFGRVDCQPGWHFLYRNVLPETISQPFNYVCSLQIRGLEVPSAAEVALMLFLHYAGTGEQLLQKKHTWCKDGASLGRHVTVGAFGRNGLFISGHPAEFASRGLGVCPKLMKPFD